MTHDTPVVPQRVQKLLAAEGLGSRRDIEQLIRRGEVSINGRIAQLGDRAGPNDQLHIGGRRITVRGSGEPRVIAYHKPCGEVVSRRDHDHTTVFSRFPMLAQGRWVSVGRLDINTSGLLLACTDGELAHRLMHPSYQVPRVYLVRVTGEVDDRVLQRLRKGVVVGGRSARFEAIRKRAAAAGLNRWFEVMLREGYNREVRRLWESQGFAVSRLIRIRFADLALDLRVGGWRALTRDEMLSLYRTVALPSPFPK